MAELTLDRRQNQLILKSDKVTKAIDLRIKSIDYLYKLYTRVFKRSNTRPEVELSKKNVERIVQTFTTIITQLREIGSDVNFETAEDNILLLNDLRRILNSSSMTNLLDEFNKSVDWATNATKPNAYGISVTDVIKLSDRVERFPNEINKVIKLIDAYIKYKRVNRPSKTSSRIKRLKSSMGIDEHDTRRTKLKRVGGLALGGLGMIAAGVLKSSGFGLISAYYLKKRRDEIDRRRNLYKNRINQARKQCTLIQQAVKNSRIERVRYNKEQQMKADGFLAGGGRLLAKKNASVLLGDNPGGRERYIINSGNSVYKGITKGRSTISLSKGDRIYAKPVSGIGRSKIDTSSFTKLGAGTDDMSIGMEKLISIQQRQLIILEKLQLDTQLFHKDQISRMDDAENRSKSGVTTKIGSMLGMNLGADNKKDKDGKDGGILNTAMNLFMLKYGLKGLGGKALEGGKALATKYGGKALEGGKALATKYGGKALMMGAGKIPLIGGIISGGATLASGGSMSEAAGSGIGAIAGGVLGSVGGPIGTVAGSMIGEYLGRKLGGLFNERDKKENELLKAQETQQMGFWEKLTSSDNPFFKSIGDFAKDAKEKFKDVKERVEGGIDEASKVYKESRAGGGNIFTASKSAIKAGTNKLFESRYKQYAPDVQASAQKHGVSEGLMKTMMYRESKGDPNAKSSTGALGLYQFTKSTGEAYGMIGDERRDPKKNIEAAAKYTAKNRIALQQKGIETTDSNLYLALQQGAGGVAALHKAAKTGQDPSTIIVNKKTGRTLRQNMDVNGGKGMSAQQFLDFQKKEYYKQAKLAGVTYDSTGVGVTQKTVSPASTTGVVQKTGSPVATTKVASVATTKVAQKTGSPVATTKVASVAPTTGVAQKTGSPVAISSQGTIAPTKMLGRSDLLDKFRMQNSMFDSESKANMSKLQTIASKYGEDSEQYKSAVKERVELLTSHSKKKAYIKDLIYYKKGTSVSEDEFNKQMSSLSVGKKIGSPPTAPSGDLASSSPTAGTPVPSSINTTNTKIQESKVDIAQAKMASANSEQAKTPPVNIINNNSSSSTNKGGSSPVTVSSSDTSYASTLIKGYGV